MAKCRLARWWALDRRIGVCARDGDGLVDGLFCSRRSMLLASYFRRRGGSGLDGTRAEGSALQLGGGGGCLCRGRLQLERRLLLLGEGRRGLCELVAWSEGRFFNIGQVAVGRGREAGRKSVLAECRGLGAKSGSVGG